jgi:DNA-binding winged helix-turn-helix (wHTH) protein
LKATAALQALPRCWKTRVDEMSRGRSLADLLPISVVNGPSVASAVSSLIDLTMTAEFHLGALEVRPATCEVIGAAGAARLQPRVMQVLVALARVGGEVVSRRSLVEACWGDIAIGDDALNRRTQRLRRLWQEEAPGAFVIETAPRRGYQISCTETDPPPESPCHGALRRPLWPVLAGGLFVMTLLAAIAGYGRASVRTDGDVLYAVRCRNEAG